MCCSMHLGCYQQHREYKEQSCALNLNHGGISLIVYFFRFKNNFFLLVAQSLSILLVVIDGRSNQCCVVC